jgi:hypothetical protein
MIDAYEASPIVDQRADVVFRLGNSAREILSVGVDDVTPPRSPARSNGR